MATLTVSEYSSKFNVNESTVRYRIKTGKLQSEVIDGKVHVVVEDEKIATDLQGNYIKQIEQLNRQIEYLQEELSQSLQRDNEARQRSDTIILQLTRQLEKQILALEDTRKRSFWQRIKMALIRFGAPPVTEQNVTEQRS